MINSKNESIINYGYSEFLRDFCKLNIIRSYYYYVFIGGRVGQFRDL